jgi:hypothetical protein
MEGKKMKEITADGCDYGHEGMAYRLEIGEGSGVFLCKKHWKEEMEWRKHRNISLHPDCQFDILPYPGQD